MTQTTSPASIFRSTVAHASKHRSLAAAFSLVTVVAVSGASGCVNNDDEPALSETASELSLSSYERNACSTTVVLGLSKQIAEEVNCMMPGQLARFEQSANIRFSSSAVLPYIDPAAYQDLKAAAAGGQVIVNSGFRTVAQQYLLYRWYQLGRCGITAAARPGRSNHESGRALDISNYDQVSSRMAAHGWHQTVSGDIVHFDHISSPDIRGADVQAFQRLWNRNHPADKIAEDGDFGPMTASRLAQSPGEGFAKGAACGNPPPPNDNLSAPAGTDGSDDEGDGNDPSGTDAPTYGAGTGGCQSNRNGGSGALLLMAAVVALHRRRKACTR
jgi:hypothetical protein